MGGLCTLSSHSCSLESAGTPKEWVSCNGKALKCYCKCGKRSASSLDLIQNAEKALQTEGRRHILGDAAPCSTTCGMDLCLAR